MRALLLVLIGLVLTGCGEVRQLNVGADGPWRVTVSPAARTAADYGGETQPGRVAVAWCDFLLQEIRISSDRPRDLVIADSWHELGHRLERDYPEVWTILNALDAPGFPCGSDDLHAAQREARRATAEANR